MSTIKPTLSVPIFDGEVTVHGFGRDRGVNFSFKGIDACVGFEVYDKYPQIFEALRSIPSLTNFFAPSPVLMNAQIIEPSGMCARSWSFLRTTPLGETTLFRGKEADGMIVRRKESYAMSAIDCALVVARSRDFVIAAHAGRNSVVDMNAMKGEQPRWKESVVNTICEAIYRQRGSLHDTQVWVGFSISPGSHFAHSIFDEKNPHNQRMVNYLSVVYGRECFKDDGQNRTLGWLDTKELIRRQFVKAGVREENIDLDSVCTYSDKDANGAYTWYSNKRPLIAGEEQHRNLFAVVVN